MSLQWPVVNNSITGYDSSGAQGSIPGWFVSTAAATLGAITFSVDVPNFPDGLGSYQINGTLANIKPTGASSGNQPDAYRITTNIDPANAGYNMTGGTDGLQILTTIGSSGGASGTNYGAVYSTHATMNMLSGTASDIGAHLVDVSVPSGCTVTNIAALTSTANLAGTIGNYVGLKVNPSGAASISGNTQGVYVRLTDLTGVAANNGIKAGVGAGTAMQIENGRLLTSGGFQAQNSQSLPVNYNLLQNGLTIPASSPLSGTDVIINDFGGLLDAQDNLVASGPVGFGFVGFTSGTRVQVATGKTVDRLIASAAGIQPYGSGSGVITSYEALTLGVNRSVAFSPTITTAYGLRIDNSAFKISGSGVTNAFGISIEDSGAENFMKKSLAINTASKKVSSGTVGLELESKSFNLTGSARILAQMGSGSLPSYSFIGDTATGMWSNGGECHIAVSGVDVANFWTNGSTRVLSFGTANTASDITAANATAGLTMNLAASHAFTIVDRDGSGSASFQVSASRISSLIQHQMLNVTTVQKNALTGLVPGLLVFDTTLSKMCVYSGSAWQTITSV